LRLSAATSTTRDRATRKRRSSEPDASMPPFDEEGGTFPRPRGRREHSSMAAFATRLQALHRRERGAQRSVAGGHVEPHRLRRLTGPDDIELPAAGRERGEARLAVLRLEAPEDARDRRRVRRAHDRARRRRKAGDDDLARGHELPGRVAREARVAVALARRVLAGRALLV